MRKYNLIIITENQKSIEMGNKIGRLICSAVGSSSSFKISKYEKFTDSYKIEIKDFIEGVEPVLGSIELTDRICSPWTVKYQRGHHTVELIFNKSEFSSYRKQDFNVIKWANFELDYQ